MADLKNLITEWTNNGYSTFTTDGINITRAIASGFPQAYARSNDFTITGGDIAYLTVNVRNNTIYFPTISVQYSSGRYVETWGTLEEGVNIYYFSILETAVDCHVFVEQRIDGIDLRDMDFEMDFQFYTSPTTFPPTTSLSPTTTAEPPQRGITISHVLPSRVTSLDLVPTVTFVVNPGLASCYEFVDMFINASYKPTSILLSTDKDFTDPATIISSKIITYNNGWYHIKQLPRTLGNKVLIGKVLFVKVFFDNSDLFYDLKLVKTGYKEVMGG